MRGENIMTFKEKLLQEHPEFVSVAFGAGCKGCPVDYDYEKKLNEGHYCNHSSNHSMSCEECWSREIPHVTSENISKILSEKIRIKYHSDTIDKLTYIDGKSDWIDLRAAEDVEMKAGEFRLISLGVSMSLPSGYEAVVVPRSSTYKNFGIIQSNHMGVIDESYCGDNDVWKFPAIAMRDTIIHVNDRICQFRIQKHQPVIIFQEVDVLGNPDRGGIGSTGIQ